MRASRTIIDLTHLLETGMPSYPGDGPPPQILTRKLAQYAISEIHLGAHYGTHMDAPRHFLPNGKSIAGLNVECFTGPALRLRRDTVDAIALNLNTKEVELIQNLRPHWLVINTGFDRDWGRPEYFQAHPYLSIEFARQLIDLDIKGIGGDFPSMDAADGDKQNFPVHHRLLEHGILILENLTNLQKLPEGLFTLVALPLKIDTDGAPARVVAYF